MLTSSAFASNAGVLIFVGVVVLSLQLHFDVVESVSKAKSCEAEQFRTRQNRDDDRGKRPAKSSPTLANSERAAVEDPRPRDKQKQMEDRQLQQLPNASATGAAQRGKVKFSTASDRTADIEEQRGQSDNRQTQAQHKENVSTSDAARIGRVEFFIRSEHSAEPTDNKNDEDEDDRQSVVSIDQPPPHSVAPGLTEVLPSKLSLALRRANFNQRSLSLPLERRAAFTGLSSNSPRSPSTLGSGRSANRAGLVRSASTMTNVSSCSSIGSNGSDGQLVTRRHVKPLSEYQIELEMTRTLEDLRRMGFEYRPSPPSPPPAGERAVAWINRLDKNELNLSPRSIVGDDEGSPGDRNPFTKGARSQSLNRSQHHRTNLNLAGGGNSQAGNSPPKRLMAPGPSQSSALEENDPEPGLSLPPPTVFSRGRRLGQADEQDEGAQNDNTGPARRRRDEKRPMRRPKRTTGMVFDKNGRQIGHRLL